MMLSDVKALLNQELLLFRAATENELAKRRYILSAHSRNLQEATRKTETLLQEARKLATMRMDRIADYLKEIDSPLDPAEVNLSMIVEFAEAENVGNEYRELRVRYEDQVLMLKHESTENRRLLDMSGEALNRLLGNLKDLADPQETTYAPDGESRERKQSGAVLVNANA